MNRYLSLSQKCIFFVFAGLFFFSSALKAQTRTWDGGGDGVNWSDPANWSDNTLPTAAVNIPHGFNVTVDGNFNCSSVTFTGTGSTGNSSTLQVNSGCTLNITGGTRRFAINHLISGSATVNVQGAGTINAGNVIVGGAAPDITASGNIRLNVMINSFNCTNDLDLIARDFLDFASNPVFSLQSGTFTLGGVITPSVLAEAGQAASFLMNEGAANATLVLTNQNPWAGDTDFEITSGWGGTTGGKIYTVNLNGANSTVVYNRTTSGGNQTINRARWSSSGSVDLTYRNLVLAGSGNKTLPSTSNVTITGTLSIQGTAAMISKSPIYTDGSTLEYKGSASQISTNIEFPSGASAPSNLIIDNAGFTLNEAKTLRTSGPPNTLTLRNGTFNNSTLNVTLSSGSTIVRGNGTFQATPNFPASVNLTYEEAAGSLTSLLELPTAPEVLSNLTINNSGGVIIDENATVNGALTLLSGILTLNPDVLLHITSGNQIGGSGFGLSKHIITQRDGLGNIGLIRLGLFTGSRIFPLGEGNIYTPVTLTPSGSSDFEVAVFSGATSDGLPNGELFSQASPLVNAIWLINRNAGGSPTDVTLSWSGSLEGTSFGAAADNQIGISRYNGEAWDPVVGINGNNTNNTVTRTGVNNFSPFIVAIIGTPLPLKFGNISAARKNQIVNVQWEALSEDNVDFYEVQKSSNGLSFTKAGVVNALGNNLPSYNYGWVDASPGSGAVFYRIKAVDNDGKYKYSSIVKVAPENANGGMRIYPNPVQANGRINLEAGTLARGTYRVELTDMSGVRVYTRTLEHAGGSLTQNMELSSSLRTGTYILKFSGENVRYTNTVIIK